MFEDIPSILTAKELLDKAVRKASRITVEDKNAVYRARKTEAAKARCMAETIDSALSRYVTSFPSTDGMSPFYRELIAIVLTEIPYGRKKEERDGASGIDSLKKSLGAIDWARKTCVDITSKAISQMVKSKSPEFVKAKRAEIFGRMASILNQVDYNLRFLDDARRKVRKLPTIEPTNPTIVVAGYPNVGKSSFIRMVSTGEPEIAEYPFTTKGILIGHFELGEKDWERKRYQIVDTPGLLDRSPEEQNDIEKQAMLALRYLADVILFIIDPSGHCGYTLDRQRKLLERVSVNFAGMPIVVCENKSDLGASTDSAYPKISTLTGEGVESLMELILKTIPKDEFHLEGESTLL
ncbi:MAG: GTP-binding protein [Thermoplasmata archaeon HGW-Thermoplasmata-1]|nr:MAG: GTP-binding protein [Thermoplasmata archaeon HGW-Thermoplasmata-1]